MRLPGLVLVAIGLVSLVVGMATGCGSLFSWNGRHATYAEPIGDAALHHELTPQAGRRYTVSVEVAFSREGLPSHDGVVDVDAKMPLVVQVKDASGTSIIRAAGWLDPHEPPNVLYGHAEQPRAGRPLPELVVVRLVGPFLVSSVAPISIDVNLGPDRVGTAKILERRLVIHDDAWPAAVRNAFLLAGGGAVALVVGIVLLVVGWFRRRAPRQRLQDDPRIVGK
jgi:hypothetical protein